MEIREKFEQWKRLAVDDPDLIPELDLCRGCAQNTPWHCYDVLMHTLKAVAYLEKFDETTALTLLFHDLGKPACKKTINGRDRFWYHPKKGEEIAKRLVKVLKLTREQQRIIPILVRIHDEHTPCILKIILIAILFRSICKSRRQSST